MSILSSQILFALLRKDNTKKSQLLHFTLNTYSYFISQFLSHFAGISHVPFSGIDLQSNAEKGCPVNCQFTANTLKAIPASYYRGSHLPKIWSSVWGYLSSSPYLFFLVMCTMEYLLLQYEVTLMAVMGGSGKESFPAKAVRNYTDTLLSSQNSLTNGWMLWDFDEMICISYVKLMLGS